MSTFITVVVVVWAATIISVSAQQFPYELRVSRETISVDFTRRSRIVNLMCFSSDPLAFPREPIPNAIFWRHDRNDRRTRINDMFGTQTNLDRTVLSFTLSQDLEANYSCGTEGAGDLQRSDTELLVARPISGLILNPRTTFFQAGQRAVIPCGIPAGLAHEQYRVTWTNGTRGPAIAQLPFPRNRPMAQLEESRYSVNPVDFSLAIDNVQVTDSGNFYRCVVEVYFPPMNIGPFEYPQSFDLPLKLTVFEPPAITSPPRSQTISTKQTSTAVFDCSARGVPAPTITWLHNGVIGEDGPNFRISSSETRDENGNFVTSSRFEVLNLESSDTGKVKCKASVASDEEIGNRILPTAIEEAELVVLGSFRSVDVLVSPDRAVIYTINLEKTLSETFHIFLNYTNEENRRQYSNRSSPEGYSNATQITHIEPALRVPYERFRVSVGIMVDGIVSPLDDNMGSFDINQPTNTAELIQDAVTIATAAAVPCIIFLLAVIAVCILCCILCFYRRHQTPEQRIAKLTRQLHRKLAKDRHLDIKTKELIVETTYAAFNRIKPPKQPATDGVRARKPAESDGGESRMTIEEIQGCECDLLVTFIRDSLEQGLKDEEMRPKLKAAVEEVLRAHEEEMRRNGVEEIRYEEKPTHEVVSN